MSALAQLSGSWSASAREKIPFKVAFSSVLCPCVLRTFIAPEN